MNRLRRHIAEIKLAFLLLTRLPAGRLTGTPPELAAASWASRLLDSLSDAQSAAVL